jgi:hypothetical protein
MNKPLIVIGLILIVLGGIGVLYALEFTIAIIIGVTIIIVGITVDISKYSKREFKDEAIEFCPHCGSSIKKGEKFCPYCQEKI